MSYDGHAYEVLTAAEQLLPGSENNGADSATGVLVRVEPVEGSSG